MTDRLRELRRRRPRDRFLRSSIVALALLVLFAWGSGRIEVTGLFAERRLENLSRFLTVDAVPYPLRGEGFSWSRLGSWLGDLLASRGAEAMLSTAAISVLAIALAALLSWFLAPLATRTVATREPFARTDAAEGAHWRLLRLLARGVMILQRAVPEYVVAFLLLGVLGPNHAWPAVLALALHNGGILGRLGAETIENLEPGPMRALRAIGASRRGILTTAVFPLALGRYLLYFFYRFETCVREATVLGMLGIVSLGYWIQDARAKQYYDEMLVLVLLGAAIVLAADLASALARRYLRSEV